MQEDAAGHEEMERALSEAASKGDVAAMRMVLDHPSADVAAMLSATDYRGWTALMLAAMGGHVEAMRTLLDHPAADPGAMLMSTSGGGWTAFLWAAERGHVEAMRTLLDHPAADAAAMLLSTGAGGWTAFMLCASEGHVEAMCMLLDHSAADPGVMLSATNGSGCTALMQAASEGDVEVMRTLLDHPAADATTLLMPTDQQERSALMLAAAEGRVDAMRLLLDHWLLKVLPNTVLVAAADYAICGGLGDDGAPERPFAPLLLLLRRVAVDPPLPSDDQVAHMSRVMVELCPVTEEDEEDGEEEERAGLFNDDQPDDARDECVRLLLELGAQCGVCADTPVVSRIIREVFTMARVPQLLNEAVLGVAFARQQGQP